MPLLRRIASFVLLLGFSVAADGTLQKQSQQVHVKPDQTTDLAPAKMSTARQNCENWALAAGLETMLQRQNVTLDQSFWVMRLNGGELCAPEMPSIDALAQVVNKEFVLENGRHVRLELHFVAGAPGSATAVSLTSTGTRRLQPSSRTFVQHFRPTTGGASPAQSSHLNYQEIEA